MLAALRYRRAQTVVVVVLSALVTTCLVLAPLYSRALEQAMVRTMLRDASAEQSGLRLSSTSSTEPALALTPDALEQPPPETIRPFFRTAGRELRGRHRRMPVAGQPGGRLLARDGMCEHVRFADGRCPTARGEIAVSADQVKAYAMPVGASLVVAEFDGAVSALEATPRTTLRIVGVYEPVDGPYWFGDRLTGPAAQKAGFDTMLTSLETLTEPVTSPQGRPVAWFQPVYGLDFPLLADRWASTRRVARHDDQRAGAVPHGRGAGGQPRFRDRHRAQ